MKCKHCGSEGYVKNGIVRGKQRYLCNQCAKTFREGDQREKYSNAKRMRVIGWYLEGAGIMSIERMEGVPNPLIIKWIRKYAKIVRDALNAAQVPESIEDVQLVELDELFSYVKKKLTKSTFGLLLIGNDLRLLTSRSQLLEDLRSTKS